MAYTVRLTTAVVRDLAKMPASVGTRILDEVEALAQEPDPARHVKKLKGRSQSPFYSLRIGRYRVILNIFDDMLVIVVVEVGHRSKVYRKH
ncbi:MULTISPECIES: type II toxin-antitoxin system RelE/ParE family toxin [unclassified Methanoculleus]|uniref:type II toxin-antitoxin system RelE family toxin n=1 Tax=unclassified Methanoculleus TaxID=2619537 RepID=UPI0025F030DE|nr:MULTISPECIES: type II toxin-antitoxin system RelE/ParE family toxin [unclassified Methanoculleus]MCK9318763.1 type II toxin-antitoxin system RelE/ParE family toxin [Methanoculleus sp.]MDD2254633.1 type II toxin-antitoxin system RelE/ParE family toxin [Methanoculleus sp.]MDD2788105.1 type II toxin-antitoxin system RelE/ParE family toxin [Methanoculleus sp.]MDD3216817.1 type II toxin-antitoxin system RelE/ParE family toxin [Methanoculleus sp.]MDD4315189.1 type II toxin-antitoxin system RelE/P